MAARPETLSWNEWSEEDLLENSARHIGVELDEKSVNNLLKYLHELRKWSRKINLIGPGDIKEQIIVHLVDGLCLLAHMDAEAVQFADVGSGGGIPGIVLKMARPSWEGLLIEARSKRAGFLRHVIRQFGMTGVKVYEGRLRLDDCERMERKFDLVTMRGFASLEDGLELVNALLNPKGSLAAYKGPQFQDELQKAQHLIDEYGLVVEKTAEFELPFLGRKRSLVILRKTL